METGRSGKKVKSITWKNSREETTMEGKEESNGRRKRFEDCSDKRFGAGGGGGGVVGCGDPLRTSETLDNQRNLKMDGPCMMPLLPISPNLEERNSKASSSIVFSGTATRGKIGPPVGALDIGVSKSAYFFRVALPGVKKDPGQFSCEMERDGKVHVRGVTTTGARTVSRRSRVFEMKFQQQCPPGPFTLSFTLPGPVDPRLFKPNFRSDGILEGVVMKYE